MTFKPTAEQEVIVEKAQVCSLLKVEACAGSGKEQPVSVIVKTPEGDKRLGDIKVGDYVIGSDGKPTKVVGVYPQGMKDVYEVVFRDQSKTRCGLEHNWAVTTQGMKHRNRTKTMTLAQMIEYGVRNKSGSARMKIPLCSAVEYPEKDLPLDPYVLGAFLGDGTYTGNTPAFSFGVQDECIYEEVKRRLAKQGIKLRGKPRSTSENGRQVTLVTSSDNTCNPFTAILDSLGLYRSKHIPEQYFYGSVEQRLDLLRGLLDTDGSITNNRVSFCNTNRGLFDGVRRLVQSLGGVCSENKVDTRKASVCYNMSIRTPMNPFSLERKAKQWKYSTKNPPSRYIVAINDLGYREEQVCIKVDAADSLYLTDEYIVTHNTSTLQLVTQAIRKPTLYMAFNKVMADEAAAKFGSHVTCRTVHSIAYREVAAPYAHRLSRQKGAYKNVAGSPKEIALFYRVKGVGDMISDTKMGYWIKTTVATFEQSADDKVSKHHVPMYDIQAHLKAVEKRKRKKNQPVKNVNVAKVVDTIHKAAVKLWNDRIDKNKDILITHDTYLKLYQLSKPVLPFDVVMLDEAQDANPVIVDIVLQQRNTAKVILVGDSYQQIYQWRGAINALERVTATTCYLTKSFRFGDAIANVANAILDRKDFVKGFEKIDSRVDIIDRSKPYTMLFRTNAALVQEALALISDGVKVRLETNLSDFRRKMESVLAFYKGDMKAVKHHDIVGYECWDDFVEASEYDLETKRMIVMAQKNELEGVLDVLEGYRNPNSADIVLSTAHKSKGLEWDQVILADDFKAGLDGKPLPDAERNLLYVAATRAKKVLEVNNVAYICMYRYLQA